MNISPLFTTKFGRAAVGVATSGAVAVASLGVAGFAPSALAKSVRCDETGACKTYCTQKLPDGALVEYEEGTNIIVTDAQGHEFHFTCKAGSWVKTARLAPASTTVYAVRGSQLMAGAQ